MSRNRIYVLYGSQTGNAESIAKEYNDHLVHDGFNSKCMPLNSTNAADMKENADIVTIVCSTTGNGDAPENADGFWRAIKKRTLPKDLLTGLKFCILALGDSNYDKFCFMGKALDKRFSELGATRLYEAFCADESTDLEEVVESWKLKCTEYLKQLDSESLAQESAAKIMEDIILNHNDDIDSNNEATHLNSEPIVECDLNRVVPAEVLNINEIIKHFNIAVDISSTPDSSQLPKSRKHNENSYGILSEGKTQIDIKPVEKVRGTSATEWSVANPFFASVNYAKWLTKPPELSSPLCPSKTSDEIWESTRDVLLVDFNIHLSGIQYQPGDSIAICVPNPEKIVNCVFERVQCSEGQPPLQRDTIIRKVDGEELSVEELLTYRLDLVTIPRKTVVLTLADHCQDQTEANALRWACCKGEIGKLLWKHMFEDQCVGVGELLALYPSCTPSLNTLINILSPLPPRAYSIATSPLLHPSSISVAMSLVRFCCVSGGREGSNTSTSTTPLKFIKRSGLCTSYLHNLLQRWLYPHSETTSVGSQSPLIRIFHKPSATFHLPGSVAPPLVLIGPGTGVAPFIGFLSHRAALERERKVSGEDTCTGMWRGGYEFLGTCDIPCEGNAIDEFIQHVVPGTVHLFFGCRSEHDWIFRDVMETRLEEGTLSVLETALSRVGPEKTYVTHRLKVRGNEIADLILNQNAYVYICGDGCHMAKDVTRTLVEILNEHGSVTETEAEKLLECMKQRRRFVLDIWS